MKHILRILLVIICLVATTTDCFGKSLKKLKVTVGAAGIERTNTVASLDLTSYDIPVGVRVNVRNAGDKTPCMSQMEQYAGKTTLFWLIDGTLRAGESRSYLIETVPASVEETIPAMNIIRDKHGNLTLTQNGNNVLQYNTAMPRLSHGVDPAFRRNGYIHPAWSPAGYVLTNANPPDHAHHYGIWSAWTSIEYDGSMYDLWNIGDKTGTVRFDSLCHSASGILFAGLKVHHHHNILQFQPEEVINTTQSIIRIIPKKELTIMSEVQEIRVWNTDRQLYVWDFVSELSPSTPLPVLFKAYRYAGFVWRGTADWTRDNCTMMTSEGKNRPEIDGSHARWIYTTGETPHGKTSVLMMSSPHNQNSPEPLRIWDENANGGRGDVFINFAPTKYKDWTLEPGNTYCLGYRMVILDEEITPEQAEKMWIDYAYPVTVGINGTWY